ncbi:MAG: response regulator transcription factor [Caldilineaceae bacterium]
MRRHAGAVKEQVGLDLLTEMLTMRRSTGFLSPALTPFWVQKAMEAGAKAVINKEAPLSQIVLTLRTAAAGITTLSPDYARFFHKDDLLTPKEMEVLALMAEGKTNDEIAAALHVVTGTVGVHVSKILAKLQVQNRTQAVNVARANGMVR